jgi:hypothetical protein
MSPRSAKSAYSPRSALRTNSRRKATYGLPGVVRGSTSLSAFNPARRCLSPRWLSLVFALPASQASATFSPVADTFCLFFAWYLAVFPCLPASRQGIRDLAGQHVTLPFVSVQMYNTYRVSLFPFSLRSPLRADAIRRPSNLKPHNLVLATSISV